MQNRIMLFNRKKGAWIKHALFLLTLFCVWLSFFDQTAFASEFNVNQYNDYIEYQEQNGSKLDTNLIKGIENSANKLIVLVVDAGFKILSIIFVLAVIAVAGGLTLRNGKWMKWSVGAMFGTLFAIIGIRILPILVLTSDLIGFTILLNNIVHFIVSIGIYLSFIMFLVGLFLRSLDKIFEHPKYFKWGRALLVGSVITLVLGSIAPIIINNV